MGLPALWCSRLSVVMLSFAFLVSAVSLHAQGCVAAHSYQCTMDELVSGTPAGGGSGRLHALTLDIGYRVFNSNKYFIGTQEIARPNAVRNHQNIFDVAVNYQFSPRWSFIADVPIYDG